MTRFHINKHGVPAVCKAKVGNCPLGNQSQHFSTREEAQAHIDILSGEEYGALPEMLDGEKMNELSEVWEKRFIEHANFNDFVRTYARDVISDNIFEGSDDLRKASLNKWKDLHYENSLSVLEELNNERAIEIVRDNVDPSALHGWFREYNSDYKPRIESAIITNPELRNASLNIAHRVYKEKTGDNIGYNEFLEKDIEVYRGGNFNMIDNDVFVSYSFDRKIAEKFTSKDKPNIQSLKIKMKDTLGSLQTTGEAEVLVRREKTDL